MSEEPEMIEKKSKKAKADFAEIEFEIGNIEFEAKGKSAVVERMFRLLLEKIEQGKLVATLQLPDEDEEEEDEEEEDTSLEEFVESLPDEEEEEEEDTSYSPPDISPPPEAEESESIPSEAYLDPPPAWDSLEDESPPESTAEKESREDTF
ncbi:MAG: hypothetical protein ACFFF4_09645 [Candidatus Thorarchaeota archaeon]